MKILKTTPLLALTSIVMIGCGACSRISTYGKDGTSYKLKLYGDIKTLEESRFTILEKYDAKKHVFSDQIHKLIMEQNLSLIQYQCDTNF